MLAFVVLRWLAAITHLFSYLYHCVWDVKFSVGSNCETDTQLILAASEAGFGFI